MESKKAIIKLLLFRWHLQSKSSLEASAHRRPSSSHRRAGGQPSGTGTTKPKEKQNIDPKGRYIF